MLSPGMKSEAVYQCGVIQGVESGSDGKLYYHAHAGDDGDEVSLSPRSIAEAHEMAQEYKLPVDESILAHVQIYFRFVQAVANESSEEVKGSGGVRHSKGVLARDMFHLASMAGLPEKFWSAPR